MQSASAEYHRKENQWRNFGSDVSVRPPEDPVQTLGEGKGSPKATDGWRRMPSFRGGKSRGA